MIRLEWTDNLCTVGWTCIHARLTPDDIDYLMSKCPKGHIHQTFLGDGNATLKTSDDVRKYLKKEQYTLPFYFDFPLNTDGIKFLKELGFNPENAKFWNNRPIMEGMLR